MPQTRTGQFDGLAWELMQQSRLDSMGQTYGSNNVYCLNKGKQGDPPQRRALKAM
jgi:hypothetical protein